MFGGLLYSDPGAPFRSSDGLEYLGLGVPACRYASPIALSRPRHSLTMFPIRGLDGRLRKVGTTPPISEHAPHAPPPGLRFIAPKLHAPHLVSIDHVRVLLRPVNAHYIYCLVTPQVICAPCDDNLPLRPRHATARLKSDHLLPRLF